MADHLGFGLALVFNYQHKPLVLFTQTTIGTGGGGFSTSDAKEVVVVKNQLTMDFVGAVGFHFKWLHAQLGVNLPVNLVLRGNEVDDRGAVTGDLSATGVGDLKVQVKVALLRNLGGFSLSFSPIISIPSGNDDGYGGEPNVSFRPRVVADFKLKGFTFAANFGYLIRENTTLFSSEISDRLMYGLGAAYQVNKRIGVAAEVFGQAGFNTSSNCTLQNGRTVCADTSATDLDAFPLEALISGQVAIARGFTAMAGLGFGLIQAVGSPQVRVLLGVRWAPDFTDTDGDGILDADDKCPTQPEDKDGFQDSDGCPDPDNDQDLIPDKRDKCPNQKEDKDTFQDDDGCPDPDNDGDGIPDIKDACPFKPETKNGFKDDDGCPDFPDKDGDGIADSVDKCPNQKEDKDGFQDKDGCPDPDNDGDGVPDSFDDCKNQPEDIDGFKDDDGCPDPDNDGDGIPDKQDKCPNKKETINGYKDKDGCPDKGRAQVIIKKNKIIIVKKVYFATGKSKIKKRSYSILDQVALTLKAHPEVRGIRVEGHTDSRGNKKKNKRLSQRRAEAVRDYLIGKGVAAGRLFAMGYGPDKPIASNRTRRGRAKNRRVEFIILEQAPGKVPKAAPKKGAPAKKSAPKKPAKK